MGNARLVNAERTPAGLAGRVEDIGRQLMLIPADTVPDAMTAVSRTAVHRVPGAEWASVTQGRPGAFWTVAATDDAARAVDRIQDEVGAGPGVDAIGADRSYLIEDVRTDQRWPAFAGRVAAESEARGMLSFRLFLGDEDRIAALNLYATVPSAFDEDSLVVGTLVATFGALVIMSAAARETAAQLQRALASNRDIGVAIGILMHQHRIPREQAFSLLRVGSQNANRKLADIAAEVAETGALPLPATRRPPG